LFLFFFFFFFFFFFLCVLCGGQVVPVKGGVRVISQEDLDEWEECAPGDPECEEVEVEEDEDEEEDEEEAV
jgi:hypothetical protein